jgi:hypothetical protein
MVTVSEKRKIRYNQRKVDNECVLCGTKLDEDYQLVMCVPCRVRNQLSKTKCLPRRRIEARKHIVLHWGRQATNDSRKKDRKYNRYNAVFDDYIDKDYLHDTRDAQNNKCYHCGIIMQTEDRRAHDGVTVERLDNAIGHSKKNCVIACSKCNCARLGCGDRSKKFLASRRILAKEHNTRMAIRKVMDMLINCGIELVYCPPML